MLVFRRIDEFSSTAGLSGRIHSIKGPLWLAVFRWVRETLYSFGKATLVLGVDRVGVFRMGCKSFRLSRGTALSHGVLLRGTEITVSCTESSIKGNLHLVRFPATFNRIFGS